MLHLAHANYSRELKSLYQLSLRHLRAHINIKFWSIFLDPDFTYKEEAIEMNLYTIKIGL